MKFISKTFKSSCFEPPYERRNDWLLSWSSLFIVFYQPKASKNEMAKQIALSTN